MSYDWRGWACCRIERDWPIQEVKKRHVLRFSATLLAQEYRCLNKNGAFDYQLARIKLEITFKTKLETETGKNRYILRSLISVFRPRLPGCLPNRATNTGNLSGIMAESALVIIIFTTLSAWTCSCCEQSCYFQTSTKNSVFPVTSNLKPLHDRPMEPR